MLKSKLRKTGVYLHLRTQSLENACYSSTTCPTLSTLFLQNVPDCPPEALSFLPRFARFYSIYYIQAVAKTHFLQVKNFIPPTEKHRVLRAAGGQKQPQISAQIGSETVLSVGGLYLRVFVSPAEGVPGDMILIVDSSAQIRAEQQRRDFSARFRGAASSGSRAHPPPFPSASDACFRMFFASFSSLLYMEQVSRRTDVFANADASCGGKGRTGVSAQFKALHGRKAQARRRQSENFTFPKRRKPHGFACLVLVLFSGTRCSGCGMFHVKHVRGVQTVFKFQGGYYGKNHSICQPERRRR